MTSSSVSFRPLTSLERAVLDRLLEPEFSGRDELRVQVAVAQVRPLDNDGCIEFAPVAGPRAIVRLSIPVEGEFREPNGTVLHVQLHVVDGLIKELELYKNDGSIPAGLPPPQQLRVFAAYSKEAGTWNRSDRFP